MTGGRPPNAKALPDKSKDATAEGNPSFEAWTKLIGSTDLYAHQRAKATATLERDGLAVVGDSISYRVIPYRTIVRIRVGDTGRKVTLDLLRWRLRLPDLTLRIWTDGPELHLRMTNAGPDPAYVGFVAELFRRLRSNHPDAIVETGLGWPISLIALIFWIAQGTLFSYGFVGFIGLPGMQPAGVICGIAAAFFWWAAYSIWRWTRPRRAATIEYLSRALRGRDGWPPENEA